MKKKIDYRKLPYFETKVVKVKQRIHTGMFDPYNNTVKCIYCGKTFKVKPRPKGNWVNGENLDKIKFPCLCSYKNIGVEHKGMINRRLGWNILFNIDKQVLYPHSNEMPQRLVLKDLLEVMISTS